MMDEMRGTEQATCTCPLHDVTTYADLGKGTRSYLRGDPTGSNCPLHETIEMRLKLWEAEWGARYRPNAWTVLPADPAEAPPPQVPPPPLQPAPKPWRHCQYCRKTDTASAVQWHYRLGLFAPTAGALVSLIAAFIIAWWSNR